MADSTMLNSPSQTQTAQAKSHPQEHFHRFGRAERIEHIIFLTSFTLLGITGLAQKFADSPISLAVLRLFGGVEGARLVHHVAAFIMMWSSIYHVIAVLYKVYVLRTPWTMLPLLDDFKHLYQDVRYYLGLSQHKAYYGRYNYAEKAEYLAVVWGTLIMAITGFMMWNPITTTQYLPGEIIPAAKAAHGAEAVLAVLAIILWHMYHVHIKRFNRSMFTGYLSREEMEEEHPAELHAIESGRAWQRPPEEVIRQRQRVFVPVAVVAAVAFSAGAIRFVTIEPATAISTIPQGETVAVFVPVTPTPRPTQAPPATPEPAAGGQPTSWDGYFSALFQNRCGACHGRTAVGGINLSTYANAVQGGPGGPGIVPGDPDASHIVQIQAAGNHPGQLTIEELQQVIEWIEAGAPEQ